MGYMGALTLGFIDLFQLPPSLSSLYFGMSLNQIPKEYLKGYLFVMTIMGIILFYGVITDIKQREVPDYISFLALWISIVYTLIYRNHFTLYLYIFSFIFFILGYLLMKFKVVGMGDIKILIPLFLLLGTASPLLILYFFFLSLIIGGIYGLIYVIILYIKSKKRIKINFYIHLYHIFLIIVSLIFLINRNIYGFFFLWVLIFSVVFLYIKPLLIFAEKNLFITKKSVNELVDGDWIYLNRKDIEKNKLILYNSKKRINKKYVYVKEGIAFIPPIFLSYILLILLFFL